MGPGLYSNHVAGFAAAYSALWLVVELELAMRRATGAASRKAKGAYGRSFDSVTLRGLRAEHQAASNDLSTCFKMVYEPCDSPNASSNARIREHCSGHISTRRALISPNLRT